MVRGFLFLSECSVPLVRFDEGNRFGSSFFAACKAIPLRLRMGKMMILYDHRKAP